MTRYLFILVTMLILAACGEGSRGLVFDDQGLRDNTAESARDRSVRWLQDDLAQRFGPVCTPHIIITDLPRWRELGRRHDEGWYYDMLEVTAVVNADTQPTVDAQIEAQIRRRLRGAVIGGDANLAVTVTRREAVVQMGPAVPGDTVAQRTYVIQNGDTLADISTAFYGTPQHWRHILQANPGLDGSTLSVGTTIIIPASP